DAAGEADSATGACACDHHSRPPHTAAVTRTIDSLASDSRLIGNSGDRPGGTPSYPASARVRAARCVARRALRRDQDRMPAPASRGRGRGTPRNRAMTARPDLLTVEDAKALPLERVR